MSKSLSEILRKLARDTTLADRHAESATTADGVKDASKRFMWSLDEAEADIKAWVAEEKLKAEEELIALARERYEADKLYMLEAFIEDVESYLKHKRLQLDNLENTDG